MNMNEICLSIHPLTLDQMVDNLNDLSSNIAEIREILRAVSNAWQIGVMKWQANHDSIPTAFVDLAVVMDRVDNAIGRPLLQRKS